MRLFTTFLALTALLYLGSASAAEPEDKIGEIRALYQRVAGYESAHESERPPWVTMQFDTVLPGTGPQTTRLTFVLEEYRADEDQVYAENFVRKVSASWNFAARSNASEYLFGGRDGELVFHFCTDGEQEVRTYFDGGKPNRILRKSAPTAEVTMDTVTKDDGFSAEELSEVTRVQKRAAQHLEAYRQMDVAMTGEHGS